MLREDPVMAILLFAAVVLVISLFGWLAMALDTSTFKSSPLFSYAQFFYSSFLKPHAKAGDDAGQQLALESFYSTQVLMTRGQCARRSQAYIRTGFCI